VAAKKISKRSYVGDMAYDVNKAEEAEVLSVAATYLSNGIIHTSRYAKI
jgi:hypothetical protein